MYQNANFGQKWFYAFIDKMEYVSSAVARIFISTDAWQTWQFDVSFGKCYVEREHTSVSETISIEEDIDYGNEYVCRQQVHMFNHPSILYIVAMKETVKDVMESKYYDKNPVAQIQVAPTPIHYYLFNANFRSILRTPATDAEKQVLANPPKFVNPITGESDWWGKVNEMSEVFSAFFFSQPGDPTQEGYYLQYTNYQDTLERIKERTARLSEDIIEIFRLPFQGDYSFVNDEYNCQRITGVSDVYGVGTPVNSGVTNNTFSEPKLNYYPYTYYRLTNHKGSAANFKPEYVSSPTVGYTTGFGSPVKIRYYLTNYQGGINDKDQSVITNVNTNIPVLNDQYGAYLMNSKSQNDVSIANSALGGIGQGVIAGAMAGGVTGGIVGGIAGTALSTLQQVNMINAKKQDIQGKPPTITGNSGNGNFDYYDAEDGVWLEKWTINDQHAAVLSDYFNRYGYRINRVKVPNFKGRENFNFIKTVDAMITGGVPMEDIDQIKEMFNKGVTIWHNPWNVGS